MEAMSIMEIMTAVNGTLLSGDATELLVQEVSTDSRTIKKGALFVPLSGENFDGHSYIGDALIGGASACLTAYPLPSYLDGKVYIQVNDPQLALGILAQYYRRKFPIPIIAVTGSVGKTTTRDMLASVLSEKYRVLKTEGNFNNEVGLPLTLLRLSARDELAVLELGMNHANEIDYLSALVEPEMTAITNIGDAHIEHFGSREEILKAKCEIFNHAKPNAPVMLNGDDELLRTVQTDMPILWCGEGADNAYRADEITQSGDGKITCRITTPQQRYEVEIPAIGKHMIYPTLYAVAAGEQFGLTPEQIQSGIARFAPTKMRMNILRRAQQITILDDAYNANPQSMRAAVEALMTMPEGYKVAVLGDMLELGPIAPALHRGVGSYAAKAGVDCLVAIGALARDIYDAAKAEGMRSVLYYEKKEDALPALRDMMRSDMVVLVKASRGMKFEGITDYLKSLTQEL